MLGNESGLVKVGLFFRIQKTNDYHEEINGKVLFKWMENILLMLQPTLAIVMVNAPYHLIKQYKVPTTT